MDGWKQPRVKQRIHRGGSTAGQALGDGFDDLEPAGAGQDQAAHPTVGISDTLKAGQKPGCVLDFIEDGSIGRVAE